MKMIRHDYPGIQRRLCHETIHQDVPNILSAQKTFAITRIEPLVPLQGELGVKLMLLLLW